MKTDSRVYFHITILVNRSVQLVARNRELRIKVNVLIIRATSCTLRGVNKKAINICINGLLMLNLSLRLSAAFFNHTWKQNIIFRMNVHHQIIHKFFNAAIECTPSIASICRWR